MSKRILVIEDHEDNRRIMIPQREEPPPLSRNSAVLRFFVQV